MQPHPAPTPQNDPNKQHPHPAQRIDPNPDARPPQQPAAPSRTQAKLHLDIPATALQTTPSTASRRRAPARLPLQVSLVLQAPAKPRSRLRSGSAGMFRHPPAHNHRAVINPPSQTGSDRPPELSVASA